MGERSDLRDLEDIGGEVPSPLHRPADGGAGFRVKRWSKGASHTKDGSSSLDPEGKSNLDRVVSESVHRAELSVGVELPWETGVLGDVFGMQKSLLPPLRYEACEVPTTAEAPASGPKRPRLQAVTKGALHASIINHREVASEEELEARRVAQAVETWHTIESLGLGERFGGYGHEADSHGRRESVLDLCGGRSSSTVLKRGRAILRYVRWYREELLTDYAFPASAWKTDAFMRHLLDQGAKPSAFSAFLEGLNFAVYVMGFEGEDGFISRLAKGRMARAQLSRKPKKQARPLLVKEVAALEAILQDEAVNMVDRYAAGVFLFNLYSRSRWSDIRAVGSFVADIDLSHGCHGYLEFSTRSHKTSRLVARQGLVMPLVSPSWGISDRPWGLTFLSLAKEVGLDPAQANERPLLPAPSSSGWSRRSVTSSEASAWLRALLDTHGTGGGDISTHSLKATLLSWCTKVGLDKDICSILGHHSTGKHSAETYSRDLVAAPLRQLDEVIRKVRVGLFLPDLTRSGHLRGAEGRADPKDAYSSAQAAPACDQDPVGEGASSEGSPSSTSSSSPKSTSSEIGEREEALGPSGDPQLVPRVWAPGFEMFQHRRTRVVHLRAEGSDRPVAQCGLKLTGDYRLIDESRFLDLRKCRRCEGARPLRDVGALTAALEARHAEGRRS